MTGRAATPADVAAHSEAAFAPSSKVRIGAEVEWLVYDPNDLGKVIHADTTAAIANVGLPRGSTITVEPGGQLELVTQPFDNPTTLVDAIAEATAVLVDRFVAHGLVLVALGLDPIREPTRTLRLPRYDAMDAYFAARWPAGRRMMNLTASLQLNIDFGSDPAATWRRACKLGPLLAATFANSPTRDGTAFGRLSHRQQVWAAIDPSRTAPVGPEPADWGRYIMDSQVMVRDRDGIFEPELGSITVAQCLRSDDPMTVAELDFHVTTLFPPIRPRGFLEVRSIDAVGAVGRSAAIGTVWALLSDSAAAPDPAPTVDPEACAQHGLGEESVRHNAAALLDGAASFLAENAPDLATACQLWRDKPVLSAAQSSTAVDLVLESIEPR